MARSGPPPSNGKSSNALSSKDQGGLANFLASTSKKREPVSSFTEGKKSAVQLSTVPPSRSELASPSDYISSFTNSLLQIVQTNIYRQTLFRCMSIKQRVRIEALRRQIVFGDAPKVERKSRSDSKSQTLVARAKDAMWRKSGAENDSASSVSLIHRPRWFNFRGRLEWEAWETLRGKYPESSQVSSLAVAETFCTEFMEIVELYKSNPRVARLFMPLIHAAKSRAHYDASVTLTSTSSAPQERPPIIIASTTLVPRQKKVKVEFRVKALQSDPAAIALLWICRSFGFPAVFEFEPLPDILVAFDWNTTAPARRGLTADGKEKSSDTQLEHFLNRYEPPFLAVLRFPLTPLESTEVRSPIAAFTLLAEHLLSPYRYFCGEDAREEGKRVDATSSQPSVKASSQSPGRGVAEGVKHTQERAAWIDELTHITNLLRTPLLRLLVHGKHAEDARLYESTVPRRSAQNASESAGNTAASAGYSKSELNAVLLQRVALLRETAAQFHRFESFLVEQATSGMAKSILQHHLADGSAASFHSWPLLAGSLVPFPGAQRSSGLARLKQYWASPGQRVRSVSLADLYLASCGYTLCTHPYCSDAFPRRSTIPRPVSLSERRKIIDSTLDTPDDRTVARAISAGTTTRSVESKGATQSSQSQPSLLSAITKKWSTEIMTRILEGEERFARLHREVPVVFSTSPHDMSPGNFSIAPLVEQLILSHLQSCNDDFTVKPASTRFTPFSYPPFAILAHAFSRSWNIAHSQCPGFPSLLLNIQSEGLRNGQTKSSKPQGKPSSTQQSNTLPVRESAALSISHL